jgi:hypothetical protein
MALHHRIEYLGKEHQELLNLADRIEKLLESASKRDFSEHVKSLTELRSLDHGLTGIVEHCRAEDRIIEFAYQQYLQPDERARVDAEHEELIRLVTNFREELKFATADRTMAMILPGMDVVKCLRTHIAYEHELLGRIAKLGNHAKRVVGRQETTRRVRQRKRRRIARRRARTKVPRVVPYTLEPHPEL